MRAVLRRLAAILLAPFRFLAWFLRKLLSWVLFIPREIASFFAEEPEDTPLPDVVAKTIENPGGLLEHLDALRKHLMRATAFLFVTTMFSFIFARQLLELLAEPVGGIDALVAVDVTEPLGVFMRVSLLSGFALALPYIALEIWMFAAPGLSRKARLWTLLSIPIVALFFVGGMLFAYFVMLPTALPFLLGFLGITTEARPASYVSFTTSLMFWIGLSFEFPLVIFVLASLRLVRAQALIEHWRIAVVVIAIVSAAITPTIDPMTMSLVMGPLLVLYGLSIVLALIAQSGRRQEPETA